MKNEELVKQLTSPSKNSRLEKFGKTITFSTGHQVGNYTDGGCCRRGTINLIRYTTWKLW